MTDINIDGIVAWLSDWFQDKLISGTNIKTINNQSLLGSGNISVGGSSISSNTISENEDLNDYIDSGMYHCPWSAVAGTISNKPIGNLAFSLIVEKSAYVKQTFTVYTITNPRTFIRTSHVNDGTPVWGGWYEIPLNSPSQWVSQNVGTYGTLYHNDALRLCDFYFYRKDFTPSKISGVTIASGIIPSAYRPKNSVKLKFYNPGQGGYIGTDGNLFGWFSSTSSQTLNCSAMWHY